MTKPKGRRGDDIVEMVCSIMDDDDARMGLAQGQVPKGRREDIVEMVCSIMDDDDARMGLAQGQKYHNSADKFDSEHQGPYEARGCPSHDRMEAVHLINSGYPKLHDELKRRRSATRITVAQRNIAKQRRNYNQCRCSSCMKYRKNAEPKKRRLASNKHDTKGRNDDHQNSSLDKPKSSQPKKNTDCEMYKLKRISTSKDKKRGTDKTRETRRGVRDPDGSQCSKGSSSSLKGHETDVSVSSFDSCATLDDEPMV